MGTLGPEGLLGDEDQAVPEIGLVRPGAGRRSGSEICGSGVISSESRVSA